LILINQTQ